MSTPRSSGPFARTAWRLATSAALGAGTVLGLAGVASAAPVWVGDLETGDTSQFEGVLNPSFIEIVSAPAAQGTHAARLTLTSDAVWQNGLKRVELNHSPPPERTAEGAELYFAWSLYLEETLSSDMSQEIGYWESKNSYKGAMAFEAQGEHILFTTRNPYIQQWQADGALTAGTWHRIAMHVLWSTDPAKGVVDVWFDGAQVVTGAVTQTLNDDNWHFVQVGLLRDNVPFSDAPVMLIDDAVEGDTLADVHPALSSGSGGGGGAGGASSSSSGGGQAQSTGAGSTAAASTGGGGPGSAGGASGADAGSPESDGGCATTRSSRERAPTALLFGLMAAFVAGRRRARPGRLG